MFIAVHNKQLMTFDNLFVDTFMYIIIGSFLSFISVAPLEIPPATPDEVMK